MNTRNLLKALRFFVWPTSAEAERERLRDEAARVWMSASTIAETLIHAPARRSLDDARARGISDDVITIMREEHNRSCAARGIPGAI